MGYRPHVKQFLLGVSVSVAFILGCLAATAAQSTARADPPAGVQRWEYTCPGMLRGNMDDLNELGAAGWELVTAEVVCLKRPVQ